MNVLNIFWAVAAFFLGLMFTAMIYPLSVTFIAGVLEVNSTMYIIAYAGLYLFITVLLIVFPVAVALDDDGRIRKAIGVAE